MLKKSMALILVFLFATASLAFAADLNVAEAVKGAATIDAEVEAAWDAATPFDLTVNLGDPTEDKVVGKAMWDENNLYVLVDIKDDVLDDTAADAWNKDSVEIYVDQNNGKTATYEADDIQLRVNYHNEVSSGGTYYEAIKDSIKSAAKVVDGGWVMEVAIPWNALEAKEGSVIGFDLQYNDASNGARPTMLKFNDTTDTAYANTSVFGELKLVAGGSAALPTTGSSIPVFVLYGLAGLLVMGGVAFQVRKLALNK